MNKLNERLKLSNLRRHKILSNVQNSIGYDIRG